MSTKIRWISLGRVWVLSTDILRGMLSTPIVNPQIVMLLEVSLWQLRQSPLATCALANFPEEEPTLAYTHLQPAQLITVGKRGKLYEFRTGFPSQAYRHERRLTLK